MDRPIIFSAPMVRALLDGRKTQTRRVFIPPAPFDANDDITVELATGSIAPKWQRGDRLWVREAHMFVGGGDPGNPIYRANWREDAIARHMQNLPADEPKGWRPSIHMPRWASRLTLEVTDVRVERLQDISEEDAIAEGASQYASSTKLYRAFEPEKKGWYRHGFLALWDHLHGPESTDANPWVAAISFTVHRENIDALGIGAAA